MCLSFIGCINEDKTTLKDSASADDAAIPADSGVEDSGIEVDTDEENPYTYVLPPHRSVMTPSSTMGAFCVRFNLSFGFRRRDQYSNASVADRRLGFGYHAVGFPNESTDILGYMFISPEVWGVHTINERMHSTLLFY